LRPAWISGAVSILLALAVNGILTGHGGAVDDLVAQNAGNIVATVHINPLRVRLDLGAVSVSSGTKIPGFAVVSNDVGAINLLGVTAGIETGSQLHISPSRLRQLGRIPGGTSKTATWTICATTAGTYTIRVQAQGSDREGKSFTAYSSARVLIVKQGGRKGC
jgi:hypothetical protein